MRKIVSLISLLLICLAFTSFAISAHPNAVELFGGVFYKVSIDAENPGFEVAGVFTFHA